MQNDTFYMARALELAKEAAGYGETPVGAVVARISDGKIIGEGINGRERNRNALCHAELAAIDNACRTLGGWRLSGCILYVTLEPCPMCAGAIINSRIDKVVFGAYDSKAGSTGSVVNLFGLPYNHRPDAQGGVMEVECVELLRSFFSDLRRRNKMNDVKLIPVITDEQIYSVSSIANEVWHEWFPSIITEKQIDYMLDKFQSVPAITEQIREKDYRYFFIHRNGVHMGYTAVHAENDGRLFLSKIYLKKEFRKKGYAAQTFELLKKLCGEEKLHSIWLTVNKNNESSIAVYKKTGFEIIGEGVTDIGDGFVMDDYFFELKL